MKSNIEYEDFSKIDVRVGTITSCENVEGSTKLLKLIIDFGEEVGERQILSGIAKWYKCEDLIGVQTTFVVNMEPRKMMGLESQGMLFALGLSDDVAPTLLIPQRDVENGEGAR